eukprot:NODE_3444_length_1220_cov_192.587967_g3268_i0.p1 GENE.NODE_3444_length_1220_cov_192.587967_g3268_i0~~NODE_3444_length_1220_cov_192.587967_g3268_i0.p1  ORF type:complete len:350 (+),score=91.47 NODE_3444_length_1220_cov_192.587967_g3268_i0:53-1051(+)
MKSLCFLVLSACSVAARKSEYVELPGLVKNDYTSPLPHTYVQKLPASWNWGDVNGKSYLTKSLNQHIPQYCGSCWAHGAMSSLADRIKIARKAANVDYNLAIQYILNCGGSIAGSCHGGSALGAFQFVKQSGHVPYDTCMQYAACSSESHEGLCSHGDWSCKKINVCRTCSTFSEFGGNCSEILTFPNATIKEYGQCDNDAEKIKAEIYARGPVAAGVDANYLLTYQGGIFNNPNAGRQVDHIVSIVGWGTNPKDNTQYWIVRNSWGEFWGEMGYFRVKMGDNQLGIEGQVSWATPGAWTEHNFGCYENGSNCITRMEYVDPSVKMHDFDQQ